MTQQLQTASLNGSSGGNHLYRAQHQSPNTTFLKLKLH